MRALFLAWSTCPILSPGVPFYRPRGGTRLHGVRAGVHYGVDEDVGQTEASIPAWLDWSCSSVLGDDGACVPSREIVYDT